MDELNDCVIHVVNSLRAKKIFGENVDKDILKDEATRKVVEEYIKYFTATSRELLLDFYERTGIVLAQRMVDKAGTEFVFTMHGYRKKHSDNWYENVQDEHIVVYHKEPMEVDTSESDEIEFSEEAFEINRVLTVMPEDGELGEREKELLEQCIADYDPERGALKQVMQNTFAEIFLLYKDGTLLRDGEKYAENVDKIVRLGIGTKYIIYKDNSVETIETYGYPGRFSEGFDKIVASNENGLIALLKNGRLEVMTAAENSDGYATHYFSDVDDIKFEEDLDFNGDLLIKNGDGAIRMKFEEFEAPWFVGM